MLNYFRQKKRLEKMLLTSIPKCGTHLLLRYPDLVGFKGGLYKKVSTDKDLLNHISRIKEGNYCAFHYHWTEDLSKIIKAQGIKVVFLYRDPRAQMCSRLHYAMKNQDHPLRFLFTRQLKTNEERMLRLIKGFSPDEIELIAEKPDKKAVFYTHCKQNPASFLAGGIEPMYGLFASWLMDPNCYSVRFEDIVGAKGGGSAKKQLQVVRELMIFTGMPEGKLTPQEVADSLFDECASTFRTGQIDSWRKEFTQIMHEIFIQEAGGLLEQWGYQP